MGNALRFLRGKIGLDGDSESLGPHGVSASTVGVSALAQDIFHFEISSQVPEGLCRHVVSSRKTQADWYRKLGKAWRKAKPPPRSPEEAARLVIQTLKTYQEADIDGFLAFYGLLPHAPDVISFQAGKPFPEGVEYEIQTLPVDGKAVVDGDGMTVYVSTTDPRESACVPRRIQMAAVQRSQARARKDYDKADALHQEIIEGGYRVIRIQNQEILARKCRIRLRGIDAPEISMPYGREAQEELARIVQGKCLRLLVYGEDQYGRCVGDVYCNGAFVQELMLKKGLVWHYTACDQRPELARKEAQAKRAGLWASSNPQKPWEWRKDRRESR